MPERQDDFYVGYKPHASPVVHSWVQRVVAALFLLAILIAMLLVGSQRRFSNATFEYGTVRQFEGRIAVDPYAVLYVEAGDEAVPHYLVEFGKKGARSEVEELDGRRVRASGQLVYRGRQRMIELTRDPLESLGNAAERAADETRSLGRYALTGEILDSKCYLGVMKPGNGKPHRDCAVRCISGGAPPLFVVTDREGNRLHLLVTGAGGEPIGRDLLDLVAEPVAVEGEVIVQDGLWRLQAAPADFRRVFPTGGTSE